ncbi:DUF1186 domain-containing protein [Aliiruegeria lutimaris]|uniref:SEC-C motif-containing protein n=1 Tax=Aliiruegeria lutimaris TaxID=571298 RepID=A0A1G8WXF3_9RHOB|nr:DUF1186 domain-containing protein [Aliiruegeria lutimaris]SDJ83078.1 SEC-C motif-containing protein [Aliiruegeria lutimaris]
MTPTEIMEALAEPGPLPRKAMEAAGRSREAMIFEFLACIERLQTADTDTALKSDLNAFLFVYYLLGEWCDPRSYRPLVSLLRCNPDLLETVLGDALTEATARVVAGVCDGDLQPIFDAACDETADEFVRSQMFDAMTALALSDPSKRSQVYEFLSNFEGPRTKDSEASILSAWAFSIAALGLSDLKPAVRKIYGAGRIPPDDSDFPYFERCLEQTLSAGRPLWFERRRVGQPIDSAIDELSGWYCFSPEFLESKSDGSARTGDSLGLSSDTFQTVLPKVGRNDPCPCGSGKKYKKCCLH